jgi:hypothetical protein
VAKSTHAGFPWLRFFRWQFGSCVHFWPFDGWDIPPGRFAIVEVYPALYSGGLPRDGRTPDQHDAYSIAAWMAQADRNGGLADALRPMLAHNEQSVAEFTAGSSAFPAQPWGTIKPIPPIVERRAGGHDRQVSPPIQVTPTARATRLAKDGPVYRSTDLRHRFALTQPRTLG